MLQSVTICICPQGGWNVRKTRLAIYKDDSTPGQESKRNVQATMCGSSPRELVIHCLGSGAGIKPFLSITVTGLAINIRRQNQPQRKTLHRHAAGHSIQRKRTTVCFDYVYRSQGS